MSVGFHHFRYIIIGIATWPLVRLQSGVHGAGAFGTAVATMGMLMTCPYVLSMDTFGPITDNANGINEMAGAGPEVRKITDRLDAVGNTTKALTKGYAMVSAGLAAFLLFQAYIDHMLPQTDNPMTTVNIAKKKFRRRAAGRHDCLPVQRLGYQGCRQDGFQDYPGSPPPV
jgi:Na+/H+-translocating membrane pyrophosphatase